MHCTTGFRTVVLAILIGSMLLPPGIQAREPAPQVVVRDVSLDEHGQLHGSLMTTDGKPRANSEVVLRKGAEIVGSAKTQADGSFLIRQVRPGLYELSASQCTHFYRVWTARAAPPTAQNAALLVQGNTVVRGQEWSPIRRGLILGGVIVTSGVIGGVIGYNINDDDDAS
jgi:hypothetical protein